MSHTVMQFDKLKLVEDAIQKQVAEVLNTACTCDFTPDHINTGEFSCQVSPTQVTYRSTLTGTYSHNSSQLLDLLGVWIDSQPNIRIHSIRLAVDSECPPAIADLSDSECPYSPPASYCSCCCNDN